jgi:benzoylformate decarboxylase
MDRAFKTAREAPSGPVFVSLPMDVMEQQTRQPPIAPSRIFHRSAPDPEGLSIAVSLLAGAAQPVIICGDGVVAAGASKQLIALAEQIGARVYAEVLPARLSLPSLHPCFRGRSLQDHGLIRAQIADADVVLMIGGDFFEEVWHVDESPFPEAAQRIQIDPAPARIARNHRVDCGLVADPLAALQALNEALAREMDEGARRSARSRMDALRAVKDAERREQLAKAGVPRGDRAMSPARLMAELDASLPAEVAISGEAITAASDLLRTLPLRNPGDYLAARGGGIGQGLPSTIGMKLALPERPLLCLSGDGSALYTIQALWTAAHHDIPVVFVILNNGAYRILKLNMNRYRQEAGLADRGYQHMDLPGIDFVALARGFGVTAERVDAPEDVGPAIERAFEANEPRLIDVLVDGSV